MSYFYNQKKYRYRLEKFYLNYSHFPSFQCFLSLCGPPAASDNDHSSPACRYLATLALATPPPPGASCGIVSTPIQQAWTRDSPGTGGRGCPPSLHPCALTPAEAGALILALPPTLQRTLEASEDPDPVQRAPLRLVPVATPTQELVGTFGLLTRAGCLLRLSDISFLPLPAAGL